MAITTWEQVTRDMADATREAYASTDKIKLADLPGMISTLSLKVGEIRFSPTAPTAADGNDNDIWIVMD